MKKTKILLSVAVCALAMLMFTACAGIKLDGKKYDAIAAAYGDSVIVNEGGLARLYVNGKAKGDKLFSIARVNVGSPGPTMFTGFYQVEKTADSGYALMDKDGKVLDTGSDDKVTSLTANGGTYKNADGFYEVTLTGLVAQLDTQDSNARYAVMTNEGKLTAGRYASISATGDIFTADKTEKKELTDTTYYYALKADGTVIGAKSESSISVSKFSSSHKAVALIVIPTADQAAANGNTQTLYSASGEIDKTIGAGPIGNSFGYMKYTAPSAGLQHFVLKDDLTKAELGDLYSYTSGTYLEKAYYVTQTGTTGAYKYAFKSLDGSKTSPAYDAVPASAGTAVYAVTVGTGGEAKKQLVRPDGTLLIDGLPATWQYNGSNVTYNDPSDQDLEAGKFVLIAYDSANGVLKANVNGTQKSYTLTATETPTVYASYQALFGTVLITDSSAAPNPKKLWIPATDKFAALDPAASNNGIDSTGASNVTRLTLDNGGTPAYYVAYNQDIRYWDGNIATGNMLTEVAGLSGAALQTDKFQTAPTVNMSVGSNGLTLPLAKMDSYANAADVKKANADRAAAAYSTGSLSYTPKDALSVTRAYFAVRPTVYDGLVYLAFGAGFETAANISVTSSTVSYVAARKSNGSNESVVYKILVSSGAVSFAKVIDGIKSATLMNDSFGHYYVRATVAGSKHELYEITKDGTAKKVLNGIYTVSSVQNGNAVVSLSGSPTANGVLKLNGKNGKLILKCDYASVTLLANGAFYAVKSTGDAYYSLFNQSGKVVEKEVVRVATYNPAEYNYNQIKAAKSGKAEVLTQYAYARPDGKVSLLNIKIAEKDLADGYSILNLAAYTQYIA
ncbi:hypothetical protein FACS1894211_00660 [Clostridia bacterium]|nr:hypothetical protein FACS1894211_00660 [Clostridia bacterium]